MRLADLWRHNSFRLALGVSFFVLTTLTMAGGIGYGLMQSQLVTRQDARVTEVFAALEQTSLLGGETDLIEAIDARINASPDRTSVYLLRDVAGQRITGNIESPSLPNGWTTVPADQIGVVTDYPYRLFTSPVGNYILTVGLTNADLDDLREIIMSAFGWAALLAILAAFAVGSFLTLRVQSRIAAAEAAAVSIAEGDLSARLPVAGRGDDLDRISQAVNTALERLAALVEAMRQVSADIAHDLRTPLNRLRINIEDAARKAGRGDEVGDDLLSALAESELIDQTFAALLRIAQIEGGARREKFAPVDLNGLMTAVAEVYADVAEDAGHRLVRIFGESVWAMGDKELLTQALANLIENAIRHCPPDATITCGVTVEGGQTTLFVRDSGPGIPEAEREKVLRRLYRLEKSRTTKGTGLGLALVKAVADLHGASLTLTDANPGLQIALRFPIPGGSN